MKPWGGKAKYIHVTTGTIGVQYDVRISTAVTCLEHLHDKDVAGFIHYCQGELIVFVLCGDYWKNERHRSANA